jgi:AcrR family transcriptional regulator
MKHAAPPRKRGRPRAFDRDLALDRAMMLFWRQGFESTSISDLTSALGINPPSLYAAFGDKERLFREAAQRYQEASDRATERVMAEAATAREAIERLLIGAASGMSKPGQPGACMLVIAAGSCIAASPALLEELSQLRDRARRAMQRRVERAIEEKELGAEVDPAALARFYATVVQGMSTQRVDGATKKELLATVAMAMRAWPTPEST